MKVISLLSKRSIFGSGKNNVVYTVFKANAWRGVTVNNFPTVLIFQKRRIKSSCYVIIGNLVAVIIAFVPVYMYTLKFGEKITFYHELVFLKNAYSVFFSILKHSYLC